MYMHILLILYSLSLQNIKEKEIVLRLNLLQQLRAQSNGDKKRDSNKNAFVIINITVRRRNEN